MHNKKRKYKNLLPVVSPLSDINRYNLHLNTQQRRKLLSYIVSNHVMVIDDVLKYLSQFKLTVGKGSLQQAIIAADINWLHKLVL